VTISSIKTILGLIESSTHQTGTMAYGLPNPSDHDRFCGPNELDVMKETLQCEGVEFENRGSGGTPGGSITFECAGVNFNVFVVPYDEIEIVKAVTAMVSLASRFFPLQAANKPLRIHLFRTLRDTLNMWQHVTPSVQGNNTCGSVP
jgi:hypothetical protein